MNDDRVITADDGRVASLLHALKKGTKDAERLMEGFRPPFAGERYLTDKEVISLLKVSRRTLQEYRSLRILPYYLIQGKVLYKESEIQQLLEEAHRKCLDEQQKWL